MYYFDEIWRFYPHRAGERQIFFNFLLSSSDIPAIINISDKAEAKGELQSMSDTLSGNVVILPLSCLIPDPLNNDAFDIGDIEGLSDNIKEEGFLGEVVAYPYGDGQYMLESGHRRFYAAEKAGYTEIEVRITSPPKSMEERRRRLVRWNLHNRPTTPIGIAKLASFLFDTYKAENEKLKANGLSTVPILDRVAADMECSKANVTKYRMLLSLIPELQELANNGTCSWASLSAASTLSEGQQKSLYNRVLGEMRLCGKVNGAWLEKEIREYRYLPSSTRTVRADVFDRNDTSLYSSKLKNELMESRGSKRRARRCDGMKGLIKCCDLLSISLSDDALIRDSDMETAAARLQEMRDVIENALFKYEKTGTVK